MSVPSLPAGWRVWIGAKTNGRTFRPLGGAEPVRVADRQGTSLYTISNTSFL